MPDLGLYVFTARLCPLSHGLWFHLYDHTTAGLRHGKSDAHHIVEYWLTHVGLQGSVGTQS